MTALSHDLEPSTDGRSKATLPLFFNRHVPYEAQQFDRPHIAMGKHCHAELAVLLPSCDGLGHERVGQVKAVADAVVGGCGLDPVHAAHPAAREHCSVGAHTLRVLAKGLVELRAFADRTFDLLGELRRLKWIDVRFGRHREDLRRIRYGAQDRLTADDDELVLIRDLGARTDDVLEFLAVYAGVSILGPPSTSPLRN